WLHQQAFDSERAREMCEHAHEQARMIRHPYTESLSLILLGLTHLQLEQPEAAFRYLNEVTAGFARERSLMDWVLRILLHSGLSRYWLACQDLTQARRETERVCELAGPPGEKTYLALAHRTSAEIAMLAQDWDGAEAAV